MNSAAGSLATMERLDSPTRALVHLAAAVASGQAGRLDERLGVALEVGTPPVWVEELLLQSVLMVGYPRALSALHQWRARVPVAVSFEDGGDYRLQVEWARRGEEVCRTVYGSNYEKLRRNVRDLHPAVDAWMLVEGYGRTLGRPGLDLQRRELCVVAQVAVLGAERQLHSHLRGALNAGTAPGVVGEVLDLVRPDQEPAAAEMSRTLWKRIVG